MHLRALLKDESGATLPIVALMIVTLFSVAALAVDHGMARKADFEAQRAADASALAGVSGYIDSPQSDPNLVLVEERARDYAGRNTIMGTLIDGADPDQAQIELLSAPYGIRATIRRRAIPTWFARVFGTNTVDVGASAEARVAGTGTANCLKPFAIPERVPPAAPYGPADWGGEIMLWQVNDPQYLVIGFWNNVPNLAPLIKTKCSADVNIRIGSDVPAAPDNNRVGQIDHGLNDVDGLLNCVDPGGVRLEYNELGQYFYDDATGARVEEWRSSCRVGTLVVYDPATYSSSGAGTVRVVNFMTVFFTRTTGQANNPNRPFTVYGRLFPYVGVADNCAETNTCAPNAMSIRLTG